METTKEEAKRILKEFGKTLGDTIGGEEAVQLLQYLTNFLKENPVPIMELREKVIADPDVFKDMLHPDSILKFKAIIQAVESGGIAALMKELV